MHDTCIGAAAVARGCVAIVTVAVKVSGDVTSESMEVTTLGGGTWRWQLLEVATLGGDKSWSWDRDVTNLGGDKSWRW